MNKHMAILGLFLLIGVSFSVWTDDYTMYKWGVADCKADVWHEFFYGGPNPYYGCASPELVGQIKAMDYSLFGNGQPGIIHQMADTVDASSECYDGTVDKACVARYRQQFLSQQVTFNSLMLSANRIMLQSAREALSRDCVSPQALMGDYMEYSYFLALCNGARR